MFPYKVSWIFFHIYQMLSQIISTFTIALRNFCCKANLIFPLFFHVKWEFCYKVLGITYQCIFPNSRLLRFLSTSNLNSWRRQWHPTPILLPGKSHGRRSLVGCNPWGHWGSDMTERLHFHFSLSCIGEGNGNPLQCSCLENPRDREAWWAAVSGVAQSRTWLKRLSSSSSNLNSRQIFRKVTQSCCFQWICI